MTKQDLHTFYINKIPTLLWVGVLLVFFTSNTFAKDKFSFAPSSDTSEVIGVQFGEMAEHLIAIRPAKVKRVAPEARKRYTAAISLTTAKKDNMIDKGVYVIFSGNGDANIDVMGLKPETEYEVDVYTTMSEKIDHIDTYSFLTIAKKPEKNSFNIIYRSVSEDEMTIAFRNGKGKKHIVALGEFAPVGTPQIGTEYDGNLEFGKGSKIGENAYVVYDGLDSVLTIRNLKPNALYNLRIYDYNGKSNRTCFNTDTVGGNPSAKRTKLATPKKLSTPIISEKHFEPKWEKSEGATSYEISVALDKDFKKPIEGMQAMDVGDIDQFYIDDLKPNTKYYWKIMAVSPQNKSNFSQVEEVQTK